MNIMLNKAQHMDSLNILIPLTIRCCIFNSISNNLAVKDTPKDRNTVSAIIARCAPRLACPEVRVRVRLRVRDSDRVRVRIRL
jgi:hypothetical protein